jgi:hypothetical protein
VNKPCWIYRHKKSGQLVRVIRPRRRAINGTYCVVTKSATSGKTIRSFLPWSDFRDWYEFVGHERKVLVKRVTAKEFCDALSNFSPSVPLRFLLSHMRAARSK